MRPTRSLALLLLLCAPALAQREPGRTETTIRDRLGSTYPITIEAGAPTDSLHIATDGSICLGSYPCIVGALDLGTLDLLTTGLVDGVDVSAHAANPTAHQPAAPVDSVFGRTGAVVAILGDYSHAQIGSQGADDHREHASLEESAEIDSDIATHAALPNVHHAPPTSLPPSGAAGGDLTGTYPNPAVAQMRGGVLTVNGAAPAASVVVDASGYVGVGTATPSVVAGAADAPRINSYNGAGDAKIVAEGSTGGMFLAVDQAGAVDDKIVRWETDGGVSWFASLKDDQSAFVKNNILVMDLGTGSVGINNAAPVAELDISGDFWPIILNSTNSTNMIRLVSNGTIASYLGAWQPNDLAFQVADSVGSSVLRVRASTGNLEVNGLVDGVDIALHAATADAHREHASLEESAEIDSDVATHAALPNVHHVPPTSLPPNGTAGGQLSGTYPNPSVAAVHSGSSHHAAPSCSFGELAETNTVCRVATLRSGSFTGGNLVVALNASTAQGTSISAAGNDITSVDDITGGSTSDFVADLFKYQNAPPTNGTADTCRNTSNGSIVDCAASSARYKVARRREDPAELLRAVVDLTPQTFVYRPEVELPGRFLGLIAEDVAAVIPSAAVYEPDGSLHSWRKDPVVAALVGAVQALASRVSELEERLLVSSED